MDRAAAVITTQAPGVSAALAVPLLAESLDLVVLVLEANGAPIAGAAVTVGALSARSDARGIARFVDPALEGDTVALRAEQAGVVLFSARVAADALRGEP